MFEDGEGVPEIEFFVYDGGGIDLDAMICKVALGLGEKFGGGSGAGEVEESEDGEEEGGASFDQEEVPPGVEGGVGYFKTADGEETGEC